ncbi:HET-domain-containing protein, partial [Hyaloscypha hepaticicola]
TNRIRLLKIGRKRPFQEMECQLVEIGLSESDEHEAVSYVWGDPARVQFILVDDRRLPITKSAYDILRRRWSTGRERLIWIDQVCINQDDDDEKAAQVQLMRRIYKGAKRVTAFLGHAQDAHLVESLFAEFHFRKKGLRYSFEDLKKLYQSEPKTEQWNAMAKFFGNPWFQRVWIVQEAASAKVLIYSTATLF